MKLHRAINIAIAITAAVIFLKILNKDPLPPDQPNQNDAGLAEAACQIETERMSDVTWIRDTRSFAFTNTEKTAAESRQIARGKNAFGAQVTNTVTCKLEKQNGRWNVKQIKVAK